MRARVNGYKVRSYHEAVMTNIDGSIDLYEVQNSDGQHSRENKAGPFNEHLVQMQGGYEYEVGLWGRPR